MVCQQQPNFLFANNNVKLQYFVVILTLITLQGSMHAYVKWIIFMSHC